MHPSAVINPSQYAFSSVSIVSKKLSLRVYFLILYITSSTFQVFLVALGAEQMAMASVLVLAFEAAFVALALAGHPVHPVPSALAVS